jgi:hypothetical protein
MNELLSVSSILVTFYIIALFMNLVARNMLVCVSSAATGYVNNAKRSIFFVDGNWLRAKRNQFTPIFVKKFLTVSTVKSSDKLCLTRSQSYGTLF